MKSKLGGNVMTGVTIIGKLCYTSHFSFGYQGIGFAKNVHNVCLKCVYKGPVHWRVAGRVIWIFCCC